MSKIIEILNCDKNYGIGKRNGLLFRLPADMAFFKASTSGHVVAMGENTLLSFPKQKPLPNRTNIVLSQDETHNYEDVINVHTFDVFLAKINQFCEENTVFIIGGASIYRQMLDYVNEVWLNKVDADGEPEVFFVNIDEDPRFELVEAKEAVMDNGYKTQLHIYRNIKK